MSYANPLSRPAKVLKCDNGKDCPYGPEGTDSNDNPCRAPADAYSQHGHDMYLGLCLNCLDDHRQGLEMMEPD